MNLIEFDKQYKHLKDVDKVDVDNICNHPQHSPLGKSIGKGPARRNILKHGGNEFICRVCDMQFNNPMNKIGQGRRQNNNEIVVLCPTCNKTRSMKQACYYGVMQEPYSQVCGSCAQANKVISEKQKQAISKALTGRELSEEHKRNIGISVKSDPARLQKAVANLKPWLGSGWNRGLKTPEEVRIKISDANKGQERTEEQCQHISTGRKAMLDAQGGLLPETKEKLSKATVEQFKRGFEPAMHHRRGKYYSKKLNREFYYKSSYELKAFMILDADLNVIDYEYEPFPIEYVKPGTNFKSNYLIDLKVIYADGRTELIEVKPKKRSYGEIEQAKSKAAIAYCEKNGYTFKLWTEENLFESEKQMRAFAEK